MSTFQGSFNTLYIENKAFSGTYSNEVICYFIVQRVTTKFNFKEPQNFK